jgi:hypothetical protein
MTHHTVRNAILPPDAVDIDFKNCMPEVIRNLCTKFNIDCPSLTYFCSNVKRCIEEIGGDKKAKVMLFTGNGYFDNNNLPMWAKCLIMEINVTIAPKLAEQEPEIWSEARKANDEKRREKEASRLKKDRVYVDNAHGIFMSYIYFKYETIATSSLYENGKRLGLWDASRGCVFMFDGLCVMPGVEIDAEVLRSLEAAVETETGLKLRLTTKQLEPKLELDLASVPENLSVENSHEEASEVFLAAIGPSMLKCDGQVWLKHRGVWIDDRNVINGILIPKCTSMGIRLMRTNKDGEVSHDIFSSDMKNARQIVELTKMKAREDHGFAKRLIFDSRLKLAWKNGTLKFLPAEGADGEFWQFCPGEEFDTKVRIERAFPPRVQEDVDFVLDKILRPIFENSVDKDALDRFLLALARAIAGHLDKMSYMPTGDRDSGKSVIMQFVSNLLEKYCCYVPSDVLAIGKSSGDAYRQNAWVFDMEVARVTVMSESKSDREGLMVYSGEDLKKMQSMKERIRARKLNQEPRDVYSISTLFFMCNDIPTFKPMDAMEKVAIFNLPNKFRDQRDVDDNKFDSTFKVADEEVEDWIREPRYIDALMHIILGKYGPHKVQQTESMKEQVEQQMQESGEDLYDRLFEITLDPDDVVEQTRVLKILRDNRSDAGHSKFTRQMESIIKNRLAGNSLTAFKFVGRDKPGVIPRRKLYRGIRIRKQEDEDNSGYAGGFCP